MFFVKKETLISRKEIASH